MASLGWIHFSPTFRDRINSILDMMDEEGVVDELGVGAFRDAFADIFFPGISTIQTRAKYFFIVPYLIKDYLNLPANKQYGLEKYLDDSEHELMWALAAIYKFKRNSGSGVIGITKRPKNRLARRPSSIYWNGLRTLGFIKSNLSLSEFAIRLRETLLEKLSHTISGKQEDGDDADINLADRNSIKVSTYKKSWRNGIDMPLDYEEADFFKLQIKRSVPLSLLGQIIENETLRKQFFRCKDFKNFVRMVLKENLDTELKSYLILAHDLDIIIEGLHLVYSNEINKLHHGDERYYNKWTEWKKELYESIIELDELKGERLVIIANNANYHSKNFIIKVLEIVRNKNINYETIATLVRDQERNVKRNKSRFNPNFEIDFRKGDSKSLSYLNYRYNNAKTIVTDIFDGLK